MMLVSKWTFQILKWRGAALATPAVMGVCGGIFFAGSVLGKAAGAGAVRGKREGGGLLLTLLPPRCRAF